MYKRTCHSSFAGPIEEIPGVYVDNFENAGKKMARAYFLSHYHQDHVQGLQDISLLETLEKTKACIYTSELTSVIINYEKKHPNLMKYVRALKTGSSVITLPSTENYAETLLTVTLIHAGHCAGSTMFLFTLDSKKILYTGDFRTNTSDLPKYTALHENGAPIKLNALFIDTTFIDVDYEYFPKRSECIDELVFNVKKWLNRGELNAIAIHTSAKYGYEFVFNDIYKQLGVKVYVDEGIWRLYSTIPKLVPGVTNNLNETRIHLCTNKNERTTHKLCIGDEGKKFLYIHLSAMKWYQLSENSSSVNFVTPSRLDVCFATHCSRKEIYDFVKYLSPRKIVGFPNRYVELADKKTSELKFERDIKKRRVDEKVDENLLRAMMD